MFGIGFTELVLILIAALIFIGPKRMPEIAKAAGKAFMEFRKAAEGLKEQVTDFGSIDDSGGGYRPASYGADVPEGHAPPPSPEESPVESPERPPKEPPVESNDAGPEGASTVKPRSEKAESGDARNKEAASVTKKGAARKTRAKKSASSGTGKKSSKSASGAGARKGKGKSAKARAGRDDGNDTPA